MPTVFHVLFFYHALSIQSSNTERDTRFNRAETVDDGKKRETAIVLNDTRFCRLTLNYGKNLKKHTKFITIFFANQRKPS